MVSARVINGSKEQIAQEIARTKERIISAVLVVEVPVANEQPPMSADDFEAFVAEMSKDAVAAANVDYSREAMYTRMPGE